MKRKSLTVMPGGFSPLLCATSGVQAAWELLNAVKEQGGATLQDWNARANRNKWRRPNTGKLLGADAIRALEKKYLPQEAQRDYESTWGRRIDYSRTKKVPR